jgi:AbrB family looped-hinge helix DNA binding protein
MTKVKVSPKFQIVIPKEVRESLGIKPGDEFEITKAGDGIGIVKIRDAKGLKGFLKGLDTTVEREDDRL